MAAPNGLRIRSGVPVRAALWNYARGHRKDLGWDEHWQQTDFARRFSEYAVSVIEIDGQPIGALWLESTPERLRIVELQLLPAMQGRGIGTAVVQRVIKQGANQGVPVTLSVVRANPRAQRLYERLGFEVCGHERPFIHMRHDARRAV